jgi:hypothetical protein
LPVLVGPSTAVTPAPRAPLSRLVGEEKEIGIYDVKVCALARARRRGVIVWCDPVRRPGLSSWRFQPVNETCQASPAKPHGTVSYPTARRGPMPSRMN